MSYLPTQIDDLVTAVMTKSVKKGTWSDVSFPGQNNCFARIVRAGGLPENDGVEATLTLQIGEDTNARPSGLFDTDRISVKNLSVNGTVPWTKQVTGYKYDVDEPVLQGSAKKIFDVVMMRAHGSRNGWLKLGEEMLFSMPAGPSDAEATLLGFPYWLVLDNTSNGDFAGKNPSGHTAGCAGIDATPNANRGWRNYCFGWDAMTWEDFVEKILKAMWSTSFEAPDPYPQTKTGKSGWLMETTYNLIEEGRRLLRASNDDIGNDFAAFKNVMVGSNVLKANAYMTTHFASDDRLYAVNLQQFGFEFLKGRNQVWEKPQPVPGASRVREVPFVNWMRAIMYNRREGGFVAGRR